MKRYFEAIARNENLITGSDVKKSGTSYIFIYTINDFGEDDVKKYVNSKGIMCIDLSERYFQTAKKVFDDLPNEFIKPENYSGKIIQSCSSSILNMNENRIVIFVNINEYSIDAAVNLKSIISIITSQSENYKSYYLNYDIDNMLTISSKRGNDAIRKMLITIFPNFYKKVDENQYSISINKETLIKILSIKYKKYFESEFDLNESVEKMFNSLQSSDDTLHVQLNLINKIDDKNIVVNISKSDLGDVNTMFSKIDL